MTMTISEALKKAYDLTESVLDNDVFVGTELLKCLEVIAHELEFGGRSRLEVHEGSALKTQGEVNAWFAGFAACSGRDVPDEMVDRALLTYPPSRRGFADRDELKAALVAALGE